MTVRERIAEGARGAVAILAVLWATGVTSQECPKGWKEVAQPFLASVLDEDVEGAALRVHPQEREAWSAWKAWEWERLNRRISAMPEPVQERAVKERAQEVQRLEVSVYTCQPSPVGVPDQYLVKADPDGRTYKTLNLTLDDGDWWVTTSTVTIDAEQLRVVTAYMTAVDENRWEEAEAWVARQALPRFAGYRLEVESFLTGNEAFAQARANRVAERKKEWGEMFVRAVQAEEGIIVVHVEFPNATELSCEIIEVDGTWRILHR